MKSRITFAVAVAAAFLLGFAGTAVAQSTAGGSDASVFDMLAPVLEAFRGGDYAAAGALFLVVLVAVARQYGARIWPALGSELGAIGLVVVGSFAATLAAMISGPAPLTLAVAATAAKIAFYASGGFALVKKFAYPILVKLRGKLPAWAQAILDVGLWVLDGGKAKAIAKAEAAGKAAVAAKPAGGAADVVGKPRDVK